MMAGMVSLVALATVVGAPDGDAVSSAARAPSAVDRVLIVSLPHVGWPDVTSADTPNLDRFVRDAAVADLSLRAVHHDPTASDSYTTLGAGTRSVGAPGGTGSVFSTTESPTGGSASGDSVAEVFAQRTGTSAPIGGIVDLAGPAIDRANARQLFESVPGSLGDALEQAHVHRSVIANADRTVDPAPPSVVTYDRAAVELLADSHGVLTNGRIDAGLNVADPTAPFGVRQDSAATLGAFDTQWQPNSVVEVETSDLERVDAFATTASPAQYDAARRTALRAADTMFGELLGRVDPAHDAVLVIGPTAPAATNGMSIAALRAPGVAAGWLASPTTRRAGFVNVVDVAPTVLNLLGVDRPEQMEGRAFSATASSVSADERIGSLVRLDANAGFREQVVANVTVLFIALSVLLALLAILAFERGRGRGRLWLRRSSLLVLGMLLGTYLSVLIDFASYGAAWYWLFVVGIGAAFAALCELAGRRSAVDALLIGLGITVAVHVVDALTGARLELNAVYGYSPTVGIRYSGIGNMTFSIVSASVVLLAGLLSTRWQTTRGRWLGIGALVATFVVFASPLWGQDFGSALALAPSFAFLGMLLFGRRVRVRQIVLLGLGVAVSGVAFGMLDLLRPSDQRTHVGRFFEKIGNEGWNGFWTVIHRKLSENLGVLTKSPWMTLVPLALGFVAYLAIRAPRRLEILRRQFPGFGAAIVALPVLAGLGFALNDSGIAIPGMMLLVVNTSLVYLSAQLT